MAETFEPGWLQRQVARSVASLDRLPPKLRASLTQHRRVEVWDPSVAPGGFVCAEPEPARPGGICGMPVESEPCSIHHPEEAA